MKRLLFLIALFYPISSFGADYGYNELLTHYLKNNRTIRALKNQSEAKDFLVKKFEALRYPTVDLDLSYTLLNEEPMMKTPTGGLPAGEDKYLKGQLILSYIIYDFGKRESIINRAVLDKETTNLYIKKEINDQSLNLGKLFYQIISLNEAKRVYEEELQSLTEHKKRIDAFFEEGLVTKNETLQINVEINNTRQKIIKTENEIANLKESLKLLTGLDEINHVTDDLKLEEKNINADLNPEDRAEVQLAKKIIHIKGLQLKDLDSDFYPRLYLGTGINYEQNRYRMEDHNYFLTFGIKLNLYSGNSTTNERFSLIKEIEEQKERLNLGKDIIKTETLQALNDLKTAENKVTTAREAISQTEENLRIQKGKYEEHLIPATELIDATLLNSRANLNYITALYEYKFAYLKLLWAKGKLVNFSGVKYDK